MSSRLLCCAGSLEGGGSERQLWQLATRIDPTQFESQIYLLARQGVYLEQLPARVKLHAFAGGAPLNGGLGRGHFYLPGQIHRQQVAHLRHVILQERIDVVYDRTFHMTLVTAPACRAANVARLSVIVSPPSRDFARSQERFRWFKRRMLSHAYRDSRAITVAVSAAVADDSASFYRLPRESIKVVESPVDTTAILEQANRETTFSGQRHVELRIAVVGRLSAEKGQQTLLHAIAEVRRRFPRRNIQLDVIGDGPDRERLVGLASHLGIQEQINFCGFQGNPYPWMKRADLLCLPSEYEGLPNVVLEAMAIGTPVLVTDCSPALKQLVGSDLSRGMLTPVNNAASMADQLENRIVDPTSWQARAACAKSWVTAHHGIETFMRRMQD